MFRFYSPLIEINGTGDRVIVMRNIVKVYKNGALEVNALENVSLTVENGEFIAVSGPSGSGKSTLMQIIGCIDYPTEGEYELDGEDVLKHTENRLADIRNKKIGFVFQKFNLLPKFDALTNVEIPLIYRGEDRKVSRERAIKVLKMVGLGDRIHHRPNELSGGQQQRVAIARALAGNPPLILADEPTGNLDSKVGKEIMDTFIELNQSGKTIVIITHDPGVAQRAKKIIYLQDGRIKDSS